MNVALVGMPNVGKTALFNALTGSFQKVANFPGVTVEKKMARMSLPEGKQCDLVDLPGLYSLDVATLDEKVARDWLTGKANAAGPIILVLDATHLQKSLYLLLQMHELGHRPIIALTQMDQSHKRGQEIDLLRFESLSGCRVLPVSAVTGQGIEELKVEVLNELSRNQVSVVLPPDFQRKIKAPAYVSEKFHTIDSWLDEIVKKPLRPDTLTQHLDRWALHPVGGFVVLFTLLFFMFQALFSWAGPAQDLIEMGVGALGTFVGGFITHPILQSLIVDGIIGGVGGVVVFLPQILLMFLFIQFLEDVGYLGRAAFLMDGFMRKLGLPGKAMVPLLSSHACAIPGVLATRILEDRRERLVAMLVIPLTTCSARLPVFTLLIAALIPATASVGPFSMQGVAMMGLYIFPMLSAILVAAVLRKIMPHDAPSMLLMELPPYRWPKFRHLIRTLLNKANLFVSKAGKVILSLSLVIWVLVSFPRHPDGSAGNIEDSYAAVIGRAFTPIFEPLGFDWRINTALIPAFGAREVLVAALATVYAVEGNEESQSSQLTTILGREYSLATLAALIVWFIFSPQCISTIAVIRRESGGWAAPLAMVAYTLALAWIMAFLTYRILV
jgi:ferrous iron transport protein B